MPAPKNRSTSVRKIKRRTPKRGSQILYRRREKGNTHACALCATRLQAVSTKRGAASRPNRKFGGSLCTSCASRVLVLRSRIASGGLQLSDVEIKMLPFVRQ